MITFGGDFLNYLNEYSIRPEDDDTSNPEKKKFKNYKSEMLKDVSTILPDQMDRKHDFQARNLFHNSILRSWHYFYWYKDIPVTSLEFEGNFRKIILNYGTETYRIENKEDDFESKKRFKEIQTSLFLEELNYERQRFLKFLKQEEDDLKTNREYLKKLNHIGFEKLDSQQEILRYMLTNKWRDSAEYMVIRNKKHVPIIWMQITVIELPISKRKGVNGIQDPHCVVILHAFTKSLLGYFSLDPNPRIGAFALSMLSTMIPAVKRKPLYGILLEALPNTVNAVKEMKNWGVRILNNNKRFLNIEEAYQEPHLILSTKGLQDWWKIKVCDICKQYEPKFSIQGRPDLGYVCSKECFLKVKI